MSAVRLRGASPSAPADGSARRLLSGDVEARHLPGAPRSRSSSGPGNSALTRVTRVRFPHATPLNSMPPPVDRVPTLRTLERGSDSFWRHYALAAGCSVSAPNRERGGSTPPEGAAGRIDIAPTRPHKPRPVPGATLAPASADDPWWDERFISAPEGVQIPSSARIPVCRGRQERL